MDGRNTRSVGRIAPPRWFPRDINPAGGFHRSRSIAGRVSWTRANEATSPVTTGTGDPSVALVGAACHPMADGRRTSVPVAGRRSPVAGWSILGRRHYPYRCARKIEVGYGQGTLALCRTIPPPSPN